MTDPIDRLRAADPVPEAVSDPSDGAVRATLQEILMTTTEAPTTETSTTSPVAGRPWFRDPRILGVAAALLLVAGIAGAVLAGGGSDGDASPDGSVPDAALPLAPDDAPDTGTGDLFPGDEPATGVSPGAGDTSIGTSCVELYGPDTLGNREYAFDGTVTVVDGSDMTFEVHEWFAGGDGATVTLDHQGFAGMLFAPDGPALEPGTRVLVAGDGGFVWSCGFTQLHSDELAQEWRTALAG